MELMTMNLPRGANWQPAAFPALDGPAPLAALSAALALVNLQQLVERHVAPREPTESPAPVRAIQSAGSSP